MTRMTPELATLSPSFRIIPKGGRRTFRGFGTHHIQIRGRNSTELGLEPGTLRYRIRDCYEVTTVLTPWVYNYEHMNGNTARWCFDDIWRHGLSVYFSTFPTLFVYSWL
ncbi:hypothetical protein AVEN_66958-1 [Araneus ventricosus]|uniref:Uncharacterized protein n=1 Tax=Araneus ventricosus TaxID=182803 RepID=A0A4Y2U506_ARAVE|nr:hypothetical protein AVEN_66958-1 [Araneus ventricosus]